MSCSCDEVKCKTSKAYRCKENDCLCKKHCILPHIDAASFIYYGGQHINGLSGKDIIAE